MTTQPGLIEKTLPEFIGTPGGTAVRVFINSGDNLPYIKLKDGSVVPWPGSGSGDKNFVFNQTIASDTWIVNHMLNKRVSVSVVNDLGKEIQGEVYWVNNDTVIVKFNSPITGSVYCN